MTNNKQIPTEENKKLLIRALCDGLSYQLKVKVTQFDYEFDSTLVQVYKGAGCSFSVSNGMPYSIEEIKPYLRPISDITEKELWEIYNRFNENEIDFFEFEKLFKKEFILGETSDMLKICFRSSWFLVEFLNSHHFDIYGLIPKGLALPALKDMYN